MSHFFRNIKGSVFWKRTFAFVMTAVVLATLIPMDVKIAKADEEILGTDSQLSVHMTALDFMAQYDADGTLATKDILNAPEEVLFLPEDGRIAVSMDVQLTNPSIDITEKNYVYTLPDGLLMAEALSEPIFNGEGTEIGYMNASDRTMTLRLNDKALEHSESTIHFDFYTVIPSGYYAGSSTCTIQFPVIAANGNKAVCFTNTLEESVPEPESEPEPEPEQQLLNVEETVPVASAGSATDIFDNTTITLPKLELKATYKDENGNTKVDVLTQDGTFNIPYDSDINMNLNFMIGNGAAIDGNKTYTYKLPDSIRVDVEAVHQLLNDSGTVSIGTVHISRDGTLTFQFDTSKIGTNVNVPFFVKFEGGLSEELQEAGKHADVSFPTESGSFDYKIDTTDSNEKQEEQEPGDVIIEKSGAQIISNNGKNYIEWTIALGLNGRESLDGTIRDVLPSGLTYAAVNGYPKVEGNSWGNQGTVSTDTRDGDSVVNITVSGCHPDYRTSVKFCTYYDEAVFSGKITENTAAMVDNTAIFNPDDGTNGVSDKGTVNIKPDMLNKSGSSIDSDGNITWTVVLNNEKLNLQNTVYTDQLGTGLDLDAASIQVTPAISGVTTNTTGSGFTVSFPDSEIRDTVTITYKTKVTDFSQSSYKNTADLDGDKFDVHKEASVNGLNLLTKSCTEYNSVTKTFTWHVVVNSAGKAINNVTVTDTFDSGMLDFVSASEALSADSNADGGILKFQLGDLTAPKTITVVTRVNPDYSFTEGAWIRFVNHASMTSQMNTTPLEAEADRYVELKSPELIYKSGTIKGDGTIEWTVTVNEPQLTVEGMTFTDILPDNMEYVPNSLRFQNMYEWNEQNKVYREPVTGTDAATGKQTITYTLNPSNAAEAAFFKKGFQIVYLTKITDRDVAMEKHSYTNQAELRVTYEGDIVVTDQKTATVDGIVGGTLDKEYVYKPGNSYVDWTVTINEARNDMSDIVNPKLTDELADYFDYVSGTLYKVTESGKVQVPAGDYKISVVNGRVTILLPNIGTDCYEFAFRTKFNCLAAELEGKKISNTVAFTGVGEEFTKESSSFDNVSFSSSSAGSSVKREIRVVKLDSRTKAPLEGARFELYLDDVCIGEAVSDANGLAVFEGLDPSAGYTFKLLEIEAPNGYKITGTGETEIADYTEAKMKTDADGTKYYTIEIPNTNALVPDTGSIQIKKINADHEVLSGAQFGLYRDSACTTLLETRTSVDGVVNFSGLQQDTYYVKEIRSPEGYKVNPAVITCVISDDGTGIVTSYNGSVQDEFEVMDDAAVGELTIRKVKAGSTTVLPGAEFGLYRDALCTDRLDSKSTGAAGTVVFSDLELGVTYYYREDKAPNGYVPDYTIHAVTVGTGKETADQTETVTVENVEARGSIVVKKVDNSVPAKPLAGVSFTLYNKDGTAFQVGGSTYTVTTDTNGTAVFANVPFGEYIVKETTGKTGYELAADTTVTVDTLGNTEISVVNNAIKFDLKIVKEDQADHTPLVGAVLGLYTQGGVLVKKGTTNANGEISFQNIAYGDYYIQELDAPDGYKLSGTTYPITTTDIDSAAKNSEGVREITQIVPNEKENGSIKIQKRGVTADGTVGADDYPLGGATFTLYDSNGVVKTTGTSLTDAEALEPSNAALGLAEGDVYFGGLAYGTYYVRETKAPDGYNLDKGYYKVVVSDDTTVTSYISNEVEPGSTGGALTIINRMLNTNTPLISFKLRKVNSETKQPLAGAVFELYKNGVPTGITQVTNQDGMVWFKRISVSADPDTTKYTIVEVGSPTGYVDKGLVITLGNNRAALNPYDDSHNPALTNDAIKWVGGTASKGTVTNVPMKGTIQITKTGTLSTLLLPNAEFTLYTDAACTNKVTGTGITNPAKTNASGVAVFANLPCGTYYIKETKAPKGYTLNTTVTKVVITDESTQRFTYKDTPINVSISKQAINGSNEVPGARLTITKKNVPNTIIDSWTSGTNAHKISASLLEVGTTYVLTEQLAPNGYGYAEAIEFTIREDGSIVTGAEKSGQTIIMRDAPVSLSITKVDADSRTVLPGAILAIYDNNNQEIDRWTSDAMAHRVTLGKLIAPTSGYNYYTLKELSAPHGYEIAEGIRFAVKSDGTIWRVTSGTFTQITDGRIVMEDKQKPANTIYVRKQDETTQLGLEGAMFELTCSSDPDFSDTWESNGRQHPITLDGSLDGVFTLKELSAPDGYVVADEIQFRIVDDKIVLIQGDSVIVNGAGDTLTVRDTRLGLSIRKQNGFGTLLNGAELKVSEYDPVQNKIGAAIAVFTSSSAGAEVIDFTKLACGKTYILQELEAPDGYKLAEDIIFTISDDGKIIRADGMPVYNNTIIMEDEEAGLGIRKVALEDQSGLAGSTLMLTSEDDPHFTTQTWVSDGHTKTWDFLEFTPGCTYTLTEIDAPNGYAYTDPIVFTISSEDNQIYIEDEVQPNRTVYIADGRIYLTVSKQDLYDKTEISGAELAILDENGNTVVSWISGAEAHAVDTSKLIAGKEDGYQEYILREVNAPNGYEPAADIRFAIDKDGKIYIVNQKANGQKTYKLAEENLLTMYDEPKFSISKQNIAGEEVPGATLTVTAKGDPDFEPITWVSGEEPTYFERDYFTPGVTYVLTETNAPAGYAYSESIEFRLDTDGRVYVNGELIRNKKVIMVDDLITVSISKQDMSNSQELPGAQLIIKNEAGEVIYSFVSTNEPTLIPAEVFTAPQPGSYSYYSLTEITAPEDYLVAETIYFAIDSAGQIYVRNEQGEYILLTADTIVMLDKPDPNSPRFRVPKTGDSIPLMSVLFLGLISFFAACVALERSLFGDRKFFRRIK